MQIQSLIQIHSKAFKDKPSNDTSANASQCFVVSGFQQKASTWYQNKIEIEYLKPFKLKKVQNNSNSFNSYKKSERNIIEKFVAQINLKSAV